MSSRPSTANWRSWVAIAVATSSPKTSSTQTGLSHLPARNQTLASPRRLPSRMPWTNSTPSSNPDSKRRNHPFRHKILDQRSGTPGAKPGLTVRDDVQLRLPFESVGDTHRLVTDHYGPALLTRKSGVASGTQPLHCP